MSLQVLIDAVKSVSNDEDLFALVRTFGLQVEDRVGKRDQILGVYSGVIEGQPVTVTHSWYDRCRVMQIQPDGNRVELVIAGKEAARANYLDEA